MFKLLHFFVPLFSLFPKSIFRTKSEAWNPRFLLSDEKIFLFFFFALFQLYFTKTKIIEEKFTYFLHLKLYFLKIFNWLVFRFLLLWSVIEKPVIRCKKKWRKERARKHSELSFLSEKLTSPFTKKKKSFKAIYFSLAFWKLQL